MSPLAEVLHGEGLIITGSDMKESPAVDHLRSLGIPVVIGHRGESVEGKDLVIRTAAVHDDNPRSLRPMPWAFRCSSGPRPGDPLCGGMMNALCISGTHGKTSTTSMCTHIAMAARD